MKKVQQKKTQARKEIPKHEKIAIQKSATWKECIMKRVQHEKSAT